MDHACSEPVRPAVRNDHNRKAKQMREGDQNRERRRRRAANRRKQRKVSNTVDTPASVEDATIPENAAMVHWLTPGVLNRTCEGCGQNGGCVAYRHFDQSTLCDLCLEQLGITPLESKAWKRAHR